MTSTLCLFNKAQFGRKDVNVATLTRDLCGHVCERIRECEREREGGRERETVCMRVHLCGWLAGGHEAESGALLKTICFPAESEGRLDTVS